MWWIIGLLLSIVTFPLYAIDDTGGQQIQQRIQPVGAVHVQEQDAADSTGVNKTVAPATKPNQGQAIYERYCIVCHRDGLIGAPKFQDSNDWKVRSTSRTLDDFLASAIKGLNAMPAKGTCLECSDEDLKAAIEYMLPKS